MMEPWSSQAHLNNRRPRVGSHSTLTTVPSLPGKEGEEMEPLAYPRHPRSILPGLT